MISRKQQEPIQIHGCPSNKGKDIAEESPSQSQPKHTQSPPNPPALSRLRVTEKEDWNTFCQYLRNQQPRFTSPPQCGSNQS
ncbi:hypothetical protein HID58_095696 [Brassica napus]|uniref:ALOG domain-containing protein n=1 Tax=Brassica napus TaxID=3708 RepID=A0ABQ7X4W9_BRANA|nr:hypothetical protein HID58_095696 [Brassica napus]